MPWFKTKFGEWRPWTKNVGSLLLMYAVVAVVFVVLLVALTGWIPKWLAERG